MEVIDINKTLEDDCYLIKATDKDATNATKLLTTNFTVEESGGNLIFKYGATTIASMTSTGVFTTLSDVTSNGTPGGKHKCLLH